MIHANQLIGNPSMWIITATSIILAVYTFNEWKHKRNYLFVYAHLLFVITPFLLLANKINCTMSIIDGLLQLCGIAISEFMIYSAPVIVFATMLTGYFIVPFIYTKRFAVKEVKKPEVSEFNRLNKANARIYFLDSSEPLAFTISNKIFISVGISQIFSRKELEAVILHELGHIKNKTSINKLSAQIMRFFSPMSYFGLNDYCHDCEEKKADHFAIKTQKTTEHLNSARRKVKMYWRQNENE